MSERHYHLVSGGAGSWLAARVDMLEHPNLEHRFVFTDTLYEDADCYRFLIESTAQLLGRSVGGLIPTADEFPDYRVPADTPIEEYAGNPEWRRFLANLRESALRLIPEMTWLVEGRDVWEIYRDRRILGNSQKDPCSDLLKRREIKRWRKKNCDPATSIFTVGIGPDEAHRYDDGDGNGIKHRQAKNGWRYVAPLIGSFEGEIGPFGYLKAAGIARPRLYALGYMHNNCGGYCCKAGIAHYQNRYRVQPDRFAYDKMMEAKIMAFTGSPFTMLTDRSTDNVKKPLSLGDLEARMAANPQMTFEYDPGDSGCGCMIDAA